MTGNKYDMLDMGHMAIATVPYQNRDDHSRFSLLEVCIVNSVHIIICGFFFVRAM